MEEESKERRGDGKEGEGEVNINAQNRIDDGLQNERGD